MADNKFGLPEALINAVRQVAETSALLPRDDRERDLERQAALKPESLDEVTRITSSDHPEGIPKSAPGARKAAAGVVKSQRKRNVGFKPGFKGGPNMGPQQGSTVGLKVREEAELVSEASGMTHIGYVDDDKASKFYRHMEMGNESFVAERHGEKHIPGKIAIYTSNSDSANHAKKFPHFQENKIKEETDLDEAKLSPEDRERYQNRKLGLKPGMTPAEEKAAKAAAAAARAKLAARRLAMKGPKGAPPKPPKPKKPQAYVHPEGEPEARENETPNDNPNENIITQLRKLPVEGKHRITFKNGKTHLIPKGTVSKALLTHTNMHPSKKGDFQERLAASLESFQDAVKNPENEAPKPKGKFALSTLKDRPNFMGDLDRLSKAYKEKQAAKKKG